MLDRRVILGGLVATATACVTGRQKEKKKMYGLIGSMTAQSGQREALAGYLLEGLSDMPGCLSYIVANDPQNADKLWITEVWDSHDSHIESLKLPSVKAAIAKARPIIAGMGDRQETVPLGGQGLKGIP